MATEEEDELFQFVLKSLDGLNNGSYRQRAKIMLEHFKVLKSVQNIDIISCEAQVGSFTAKLFKLKPSFEETLVCSENCLSRHITQPVISVRDDSFDRFTNVFENYILRSYRCNGIDCNKYTTKEDVKIGIF